MAKVEESGPETGSDSVSHLDTYSSVGILPWKSPSNVRYPGESCRSAGAPWSTASSRTATL